jgi:hypothetical protein
MTPDAITRLFKEAYDTFPPLEGKPMDDDLLAIREALLPCWGLYNILDRYSRYLRTSTYVRK